MKSFEAVTGPKTDKWLAKTIGVLVTAIGVTLLLSQRRGKVSEDAATLGVATAVGLIGMEVFYTAAGRISKVYLGDAAVEAGLAAGWIAAGIPLSSRQVSRQVRSLRRSSRPIVRQIPGGAREAIRRVAY
jgi:hypothetical protein